MEIGRAQTEGGDVVGRDKIIETQTDIQRRVGKLEELAHETHTNVMLIRRDLMGNGDVGLCARVEKNESIIDKLLDDVRVVKAATFIIGLLLALVAVVVLSMLPIGG